MATPKLLLFFLCAAMFNKQRKLEEVFPVDGAPEGREPAFWIPVDPVYSQISRKLEGLELERCLNSTSCLTETPKVVTVLRGSSASIFISNVAYQSFLYDIFKVSPADMESASVALICLQQRTPFIAFRALSGGRSPLSDKASTFLSIASNNSVIVVLEFIKKLSENLVIDTGVYSEEDKCIRIEQLIKKRVY